MAAVGETITTPDGKKRDLLSCKQCKRKVYWDFPPGGGPEVPYFPTGKRHFCFPCGAKGWDSVNNRPTKGCGAIVIVASEPGEDLILVTPTGRVHKCNEVRKLRGLPLRKNSNEEEWGWVYPDEVQQQEQKQPAEAEPTIDSYQPQPQPQPQDIRSMLAEVERTVKALRDYLEQNGLK